MSAPSFRNRYVDLDGTTYRVCHMLGGDGSLGRLMLIQRQGGHGQGVGMALALEGAKARKVLKALAASEKGDPS